MTGGMEGSRGGDLGDRPQADELMRPAQRWGEGAGEGMDSAFLGEIKSKTCTVQVNICSHGDCKREDGERLITSSISQNRLKWECSELSGFPCTWISGLMSSYVLDTKTLHLITINAFKSCLQQQIMNRSFCCRCIALLLRAGSSLENYWPRSSQWTRHNTKPRPTFLQMQISHTDTSHTGAIVIGAFVDWLKTHCVTFGMCKYRMWTSWTCLMILAALPESA